MTDVAHQPTQTEAAQQTQPTDQLAATPESERKRRRVPRPLAIGAAVLAGVAALGLGHKVITGGEAKPAPQATVSTPESPGGIEATLVYDATPPALAQATPVISEQQKVEGAKNQDLALFGEQSLDTFKAGLLRNSDTIAKAELGTVITYESKYKLSNGNEVTSVNYIVNPISVQGEGDAVAYIYNTSEGAKVITAEVNGSEATRVSGGLEGVSIFKTADAKAVDVAISPPDPSLTQNLYDTWESPFGYLGKIGKGINMGELPVVGGSVSFTGPDQAVGVDNGLAAQLVSAARTFPVQ